MNNNYNKVDSVIETFMGNTVNVMKPKPSSFDIEDIAHSLSMQCRYTGHCARFYSVAEHSVLVSKLCPPEYQLWGLLHDATEAYLADIASPVKQHLDNYKVIERDLMGSIAVKFNLDPVIEPHEVKKHDLRALILEASELMPSGGAWWVANEHDLEPVNLELQCLSPDRAKRAFMKRFYELTDPKQISLL